MKFKAGDEVLIKAKIKDMSYVDMMYVCELVTNPDVCIRFKSPTECIVSDKTYSDGLNDAWDLAFKIAKMNMTEITKIFGCGYSAISSLFTAEEALAKIEAYEKEKSEIKVGDEVKNVVTGNTFWVIAIDGKHMDCYSSSAEQNIYPVQHFFENFDFLKKTGRTTDAIDLLRQIGE